MRRLLTGILLATAILCSPANSSAQDETAAEAVPPLAQYPPVVTGLLAQGNPADWLFQPPSMEDTLADQEFFDAQYQVREAAALPALEGWYAWLGVEIFPSQLQLADQFMLLSGYDSKFAISRDGLEAWTPPADSAALWPQGQWHSTDNLAAFSNAMAEMVVYDMATAEQLWSLPAARMVRLGTQQALVLRGDTLGQQDHGQFRAVELRDTMTGDLLWQRDLGLSYSAVLPAGDARWPVAILGEGKLYLVDEIGELSTLLDIGGAVFRAAACDADRLVVQVQSEFPGMDLANVDEDPALLDGTPLLRMYDIHSGELLWEQPQQAMFQVPVLNMTMNDELILISHDSGFRLYDRSDGSLLFEQQDGEHYRYAQFLALGSAGLYWSGSAEDGMTGIELLNPLRDVQRRLPALESLHVNDIALDGNEMLVLFDSWPLNHSYWSVNSHLLSIRLDAQGEPLPGELAAYRLPPDYAELVARYMALEDPSRDTALMLECSAAGINAFRAVQNHAAEMSSTQLDSLALLALAMTPPPDPQSYFQMYSCIDSLIAWLINNGNESMTADMLRWQETEGLFWMPFAGAGIIAACGGHEARLWLDEYYAGLLAERGEQPGPPYAIQPEGAVFGDIFQPDGQAPEYWQASVVTEDSTRYLAYVADGLSSERDIFLAIDNDADGAYEEVLSTGLSHTYFYMRHPGGPLRVDPDARDDNSLPSRGIELSVDGDLVSIGHYVPELERHENDYREQGGEVQVYYEMNSAAFAQSSLDLATLRQDSDADGLPDVAERQMLTDPLLADSDGDGIADGADRNPLADSADLGPEERMLSRGIAFFTQYSPGFDYWWRSRVPGQPLCARYIELPQEIGPVAIGGQPGTWNICLTSPQMKAACNEHLQGYNSFNRISIETDDAPGIYGNELSAYTTFGPQFPSGTARLMHLSMALQGQFITFVEIEGEYYPVTVVQSWIS